MYTPLLVPRSRRGEDTGARVAIDVHIAQGAEAIEPGIGHPFHHTLLAVFLHLSLQIRHRPGLGAQIRAVGGQHPIQSGGDLAVQLAAGRLGKAFEGSCVHGGEGNLSANLEFLEKYRSYMKFTIRPEIRINISMTTA